MRFKEFGEEREFEPATLVSGRRIFYVGAMRGTFNTRVKDSRLAFKGVAEGKVHIETEGETYVKRDITVPPGKHLVLSYKSLDSKSVIEDVVHVSAGARLTYDGRFKSDLHEFSGQVHIVHGERDAKSDVNVRGIVHRGATLRTTGEVLPGSDGSEVSVNSLAVVFGNGRVRAVPELLIKNPKTKSYHSFKKVHLSPEQLFYMQSRGFEKGGIEKLYERLIIGD